MSSISLSAKYVRNKAVSTCCHRENHAVLFNSDTGKEKFINNTALWIWRKLTGKQSCNTIVHELTKVWEVTPTDKLTRDLFEFLEELHTEGYIDVCDGSDGIIKSEDFKNCSDRPKGFDVSLTGKCNLHCEYCFYSKEMHDRPDLPKQEWRRFFEELGGLGVRNLTLSGGEVFVRPDLFELLDHIVENRMRFSFLSNGTLINEKVLLQLEMSKRRKRLNYVQISLDGSCPEIHDKSRGAGSFAKAFNGLKLLREAGFPVAVRVTINRFNVDDLKNVTRLLLEDVGLPNFGTNDAIPMGAGCENQRSITLSPKQQLKAILTMHELDQKYPGRISASAGPLAKWQYYSEMEHAKATGEKSKRYVMGYLTACGCMFGKLSVHHDGIITPCNMLPDLEMGRINQVSIQKIWRNSPILKDMKKRRSIPMSDVSDCKDCEWQEFCNGSCPGLPFTQTGDFNRANLHDCYRKFLKDTGLKSPHVPWAK